MPMLNIAPTLQIPIEPLQKDGHRIAIIGKSGSGKTHSQVVIVEECLAAGIPITFVDPMAQAVKMGLVETQPVILAGRRKAAHVEITQANAEALALLSFRERVSIVLDMSLYEDDEAMDILETYLSTLWRAIFAEEDGQPYALVIDEAQLYCPQGDTTPLKPLIIDMAKRGRHKKLTTVVATQRAASLDKNFLTQATMLMAHRLGMGIDTAVLREQLAMPARELNAMMHKLKTGEALVMAEPVFLGDDDYRMVQVRERGTAQPDTVLSTEYSSQTPARVIDESILAALQALMKPAKPAPAPSARDHASRDVDERIAALEAQNASIRAEKTTAEMERDALAAQVERLLAQLAEGARMDMDTGAPIQFVDLRAQMSPRQVALFQADRPLFDEPLPPTDQYRSPRAIVMAKGRQQKRFNGLLRTVSELRPMHRDVLFYLIDCEGEDFSLEEIAQHLGLSITTLKDRPPLPLVEMKLVQRIGERRGYRYASRARSTLRKEFPDLEIEALLEQLFRELEPTR